MSSETGQTNPNTEIIYKYNEIKQKYTVFFSKAIELEDQLREHNLVADTLGKIENTSRRCWRMVGGVLVEKDLETVRKELDLQIANIKQTLEVVHKTLKTQEGVLREFEVKYADILKVQKGNQESTQKGETKTSGVLV